LTALRDTEETVSHVNRVGAYAAEIYDAWARRKGIAQDVISSQKDLLRMAAMLHDIGKLAIPNVIRRKPGRLSVAEYETMKEQYY
jgi:HD-GYP domain-containing protein (c-di-GMP phosphodiesterase class II)